MLHWKFWVHDSTIGGMVMAVIPIMACAWKKPNRDNAFAATWAAVFECPKPEVMADAASPRPAMTAVVQPTAFW
jgi:hypothetical protein